MFTTGIDSNLSGGSEVSALHPAAQRNILDTSLKSSIQSDNRQPLNNSGGGVVQPPTDSPSKTNWSAWKKTILYGGLATYFLMRSISVAAEIGLTTSNVNWEQLSHSLILGAAALAAGIYGSSYIGKTSAGKK
jgi:hypothetical protein